MNGFNFDFSFQNKPVSEDKQPKTKQKENFSDFVLCSKCGADVQKAAAFTRKANNIYRKAYSELNLFDILPKDFNPDDVIHVISSGDVDSLSYLKYLSRFQNIDYLLFSTWCMASDDILCIDEMLESKKLNRIDAYVGEIFTGTYSKEYALLKSVIGKRSGRVCVFRNHSKIFAGIGDKFAFVIESSANINTNPRAENTTITISHECFDFYKNHFDSIKSFSNDYKDWKPYKIR